MYLKLRGTVVSGFGSSGLSRLFGRARGLPDEVRQFLPFCEQTHLTLSDKLAAYRKVWRAVELPFSFALF